MDNLPPQIQNGPTQNIWEANPKLKILLLVLIFVFLASGIALVVLAQIGQSYRQQLYEQTESGLPKHKTGQTESWTSQPVDVLNMEISFPNNWELKHVEGLDGAVMVYPKDLYDPNYEHDYVILIEAAQTTSTVFVKKDNYSCVFSNTSLAGLPAVLCKENGASLISYFYRVTETSGTRWSAENMVSFSLPKNRLDLLPTYEKVLNSLKIFVQEIPEASKSFWEKYENSDYGFEIRYPEKYGQYTLLSEGEEAEGEGSGFFGLTIYGMPKVLSSQDFAVPENFVNLDIKEGESIDNWLKVYSEIPDIEVGEVSKEKIGNLDVTTYRSILTTESGPDAVLMWALWEKDGWLYGYNCPVDKYTNLCQEILKTFKFTAAGKSSVKVYKNKEYGFEFEYPSNWKLDESAIFNKNEQNISVISQTDYTSRIAIIPNGGFDHGWPGTNPTITKIKFAGEDANKIYWDEKLYQTITFLKPKANWSNYNRIEASFGKDGTDKELVEKILSTFKFTK